MIKEITKETIDDEIKEGKTIIKFSYSSGCLWCEKIKPVFEAYSEKHKDIKYLSYSAGPFKRGVKPEFADRFHLNFLPSFGAFQDGKFVGLIRREEFIKDLDWKFDEPAN